MNYSQFSDIQTNTPSIKKTSWNLSHGIQIRFEIPIPGYEVRQAFKVFILKHNYKADQTRFLRTVQTVFMQKRKLEEADLYEAPFTNFGNNAVEKYFTPEEIDELMELTKKLAA